MGRAHALAYHQIPEFEVVGICTRSAESRERLNDELGGGYPLFDDYGRALESSRPEAVSISTYTDSHASYAEAALRAGCDVFIEKPLAETVEQAEALVALAGELGRKLVVGYILRHHPVWQRFIEEAHTLGKPLVMRMNLNQQSSGATWVTHKNLMKSASPVVDCGVHYIDVMCQMTHSKPIRVAGLGARLSNELPAGQINYGQLQVTFEDGSVGWYEAGWGPMMSDSAGFVKDVVGPDGAVTIEARSGGSADVEAHVQTKGLKRHFSSLNAEGEMNRPDEWLDLRDEPDHDELCRREQLYFLDAIMHDRDLSSHLEGVLNSMRIVAAADRSYRDGEMVSL